MSHLNAQYAISTDIQISKRVYKNLLKFNEQKECEDSYKSEQYEFGETRQANPLQLRQAAPK